MELDPSLFGVNPEPLRYIPCRFFEVDPFRERLDVWAKKPLDAVQPVLRLLNGEPMVCHGNRIEAIVRDEYLDCANRSDEEVVKLWFTENPKFGVALACETLGVSVRIVPGTIRLVDGSVRIDKKRLGSKSEYTSYREMAIEFDTVFECLDPVKDLSEDELAEPLMIKSRESLDGEGKIWLQALKAVLRYPGRMYIMGWDSFIVRIPETLEEASRILACSIDGISSLEFVFLVLFGKSFAPSAKQRKILDDGDRRFRFFLEEEKCEHTMLFGNLAQKGYCLMFVRIPLVKTRPRLFVKNIRRGLAMCTEFVERCVAQGKLEMVSIKQGCFEFRVRISATSPCQEINEFLIHTCVFEESKPQWSDSKMVEVVSGYVFKLREYLATLADFAESLLKGSNDMAVMRKNLIELMIHEIQLSPISYVDDDYDCISNFANFCISGEWGAC